MYHGTSQRGQLEASTTAFVCGARISEKVDAQTNMAHDTATHRHQATTCIVPWHWPLQLGDVGSLQGYHGPKGAARCDWHNTPRHKNQQAQSSNKDQAKYQQRQQSTLHAKAACKRSGCHGQPSPHQVQICTSQPACQPLLVAGNLQAQWWRRPRHKGIRTVWPFFGGEG